MPWGDLPFIGIVLGPICGFLEYKLLMTLISAVNGSVKPGKLLLLFFAKLGVYALFLVPAVLISVPDGIAAGGLAGLTLIVFGVINAFRKRGEGK